MGRADPNPNVLVVAPHASKLRAHTDWITGTAHESALSLIALRPLEHHGLPMSCIRSPSKK